MHRTILLGVLMSAFACRAIGSPILNMRIELTAEGEGYLVPDDMVSPCTPSTKLWENWSQIGGGISVPHSFYRIGGDEVGEVCYGVPGAGGRIGDIGMSLYNFSTSGTITRYRQTLRVYSTDGNLIMSHSTFIGTFISPGSGIFGRFGENAAIGHLGSVDDNFRLSLQFSDISGVDISDIGVIVGGPISYGTSPAYSFNRTTGEQIDLPGDDHFMMFMHTDSVPAPGAFALVIAGIPVVLRRRR